MMMANSSFETRARAASAEADSAFASMLPLSWSSSSFVAVSTSKKAPVRSRSEPSNADWLLAWSDRFWAENRMSEENRSNLVADLWSEAMSSFTRANKAFWPFRKSSLSRSFPRSPARSMIDRSAASM